MSSSSTKRLLTRRWVWVSIAALVIFVAGLAFGAGGASRGEEQDCRPASSSAVANQMQR